MYRIGVDLGGTNIAAGLVDENYNIIKKASVPTNASRGADAIVADISALCIRLCEEAGIAVADIDAIGIASPGIANHTDGYVEYANNLPFKHLPICEMVKKATGVKEVHVENDANAAAWGEAVAGAAKGADNSVMITLGTGVGGGIVIDGKVYSGFNYAGAELGHIVIEHNGRPCSCGRKGCWEAYSSATALIKMTNEKLDEYAAKGEPTVMTELVEKKGRVTGRTAFDAMRLGDKAGKEVVDMYLEYLACGLASIINIFQPRIITIGGGISGEGQSLIDALEPLVRAEQYGCGLVKLTEIRIAKLGNDAGIIGAAFLGI
jgi:glucokinase